MAKREWFPKQKDILQKNRNMIVYTILVLALLGTVVGWGLLPDQVTMQSVQEGAEVIFRPKNTMLLIHLGMTTVFSGLFWKWPRELAYLFGAAVSLLLVYGLLAINLG